MALLRDPLWLERTPSTQDWLREALAGGHDLPDGFVVAAREQTAGRGRQGRAWSAPPGEGLAFSILLHDAPAPRQLSSLPQAGASGLARALADEGLSPTLKWPNDLLVGGCKLAGLLAERFGAYACLGIGLNVNQTGASLAPLGRPATSLHLLTGQLRATDDLLAELLPALDGALLAWREEGFAGIREAWLHYALPAGREVSLHQGRSRLAGRIEAYGPHGELLLRLPGGEVRACWSGELETTPPA